MPTASRMVYATSAGDTGRWVAYPPCLSVLPSTSPGFTPAPANSSDAAWPQWSRPASLFTFGDRPNSPITTSSVSSYDPRALMSPTSADTARSNSGSFLSRLSKILAWWSHPP